MYSLPARAIFLDGLLGLFGDGHFRLTSGIWRSIEGGRWRQRFEVIGNRFLGEGGEGETAQQQKGQEAHRSSLDELEWAHFSRCAEGLCGRVELLGQPLTN